MHSSAWPLFDLVIKTEHLELRYPSDNDLMQLANCASAGIHGPSEMPFTNAWTDTAPDDLQRSVLQHNWLMRAEWKPTNWSLTFVVLFNGEVIGTQDMRAEQFPITRTFQTGSWLGITWQGQGIGKEMRAAVLAFGFDYLNAERAETGALTGNESSLGVTRAIGYEPNGSTMHSVRNKAVEQYRFAMDRKAWLDRASQFSKIEVAGFENCRSLFGLDVDLE